MKSIVKNLRRQGPGRRPRATNINKEKIPLGGTRHMPAADLLTGGYVLRFHSPFDGKRFIGDYRLRIFHDSRHEDCSDDRESCRLDHIPVEEIRTFNPDTAAEAWRRGFVQCPYCRAAEQSAYE